MGTRAEAREARAVSERIEVGFIVVVTVSAEEKGGSGVIIHSP